MKAVLIALLVAAVAVFATDEISIDIGQD